MTITATAASTTSVFSHAGRPSTQVACAAASAPCPSPAPPPTTAPTASSGISASIGITAMSWNSRTANAPCPPSVPIRFFSFRVCSTIAVDDSASVIPTATAVCHGRPASTPTPASSTVVTATCRPPSPRIGLRISHSRAGRSSRPMRNSIITTPNSAKCITSFPSSPIRPSANGPITIPAIR